jgi:hypothetical protein
VGTDSLEAVEAVGGAPDALRLGEAVRGSHRTGRVGYQAVPARTVGRAGRRGSRTGGAYIFGRRGSRQYAQPPLMAPWMHRSNIGHSPFVSDERWMALLPCCLCCLSDGPDPAA